MRILNLVQGKTIRKAIIGLSTLGTTFGVAQTTKIIKEIHPQYISREASKGIMAMHMPVSMEEIAVKNINTIVKTEETIAKDTEKTFQNGLNKSSLKSKIIHPKNMKIKMQENQNGAIKIRLYDNKTQNAVIDLGANKKNLKITLRDKKGNFDIVKLPNLSEGDNIIGIKGNPLNASDSKLFEIHIADKDNKYYKKIFLTSPQHPNSPIYYTGVATNYGETKVPGKYIFKNHAYTYNDGTSILVTYNEKRNLMEIQYKDVNGRTTNTAASSIREYYEDNPQLSGKEQ